MAKHLNPGLELIPLGLEPVIDQAGEDPYDVPPKASPTPQSEYHSTGGRVNFQGSPSGSGEQDEEIFPIKLDPQASNRLGWATELDDDLGTRGNSDVNACVFGGLSRDVGQLSSSGNGRSLGRRRRPLLGLWSRCVGRRSWGGPR